MPPDDAGGAPGPVPGAAGEIVEPPTGIPAFLGPTAWAIGPCGEDLTGVPTPIESMTELELRFGPPYPDPIDLEVVESGAGGFTLAGCRCPEVPSFLLHWAVTHFFANGGRRCWIVSTGGTDAAVSLGNGAGTPGLADGLAALDPEQEPDLVVVPDAIALPADEHAALAGRVLAFAAATRRFAVLDARGGLAPLGEMELAAARATFGTAALDHGAAYYPFLRTRWAPVVSEDEANGTSNVRVRLVRASGAERDVDLLALRIGSPPTDGDPLPPLPAAYEAARSAIAARRLVVPPSGAMAGVYAAIDLARGVWRPPAGVALEAVEAPAVAVDDALQERLGRDPSGGLSINALRAFAGRGTLVWGARTLSADPEWRYVPVRRLLSHLELSIERSLRWAVLEPNEEATWSEVRELVSRQLMGRWRAGALAGATPREAFHVSCGLGTTMSEEDLASGRLVVRVGVAPVRPAELVFVTIALALAPH